MESKSRNNERVSATSNGDDKEQVLTQARLKELIDYSSETGTFRFNIARSNRIKVGQVAGSVNSGNSKGYRQIRIDGRLYLAHRLAWLFVYGAWPNGDLDHKNRIRDDNRIKNLRISPSRSAQLANMGTRRNGLKGACYRPKRNHTNPWRAQIKRIDLGCFPTEQEAHEAYWKAAQQLHGKFACAGGVQP
jgi:hypothetical protein